MAPVAGAVAAGSAKDAAATTVEAGAASFLTQLESALVALGAPTVTGAAALPTAVAPTVPLADAALLGQTALTEADVKAAVAEELPELLAALGLVPMPLTLPIVAPQPVLTEAQPTVAVTSQAPAVMLTPSTPVTTVVPKDQAPTPAAEVASAADPQAIEVEATSVPQTTTLASQPTVATTEQLPRIDAAVNAPAAALPASLDTSAPAPDAETPTFTATVVEPTQTRSGNAGFDGQSSNSREGRAESQAAPIEIVGERADVSTAAAPTASASVSTTTQNVSDVKPTEVVNQIAQQVDLYRLPGGRGVRIQLNPEGLGGVEVTVRYGATGAIELHMNIEHAATADLVQAGWGELREALALQGISPDRLVMSVTNAAGAGLSDSSSNGNARSDAAQTSSGQSGQQQEQRNDTRPNQRSWGVGLDSTNEVEEGPTVAASSRIDYRA
jgi:flagellar hook-length control protein FliK